MFRTSIRNNIIGVIAASVVGLLITLSIALSVPLWMVTTFAMMFGVALVAMYAFDNMHQQPSLESSFTPEPCDGIEGVVELQDHAKAAREIA